MRKKIKNTKNKKRTLANELLWILTLAKQPIPASWCLALATLKYQANKEKLMPKPQELLFQALHYLCEFSIIKIETANDNQSKNIILLQEHEQINSYSTATITKHLVGTIDAMKLMLVNPKTMKILQQRLSSYLECLLFIVLQTSNLNSPAFISIKSLLEKIRKYHLSHNKKSTYQKTLKNLLSILNRNDGNHDIKINFKTDIYFKLGNISLQLNKANEAINYFKEYIVLKIKHHDTRSHSEMLSIQARITKKIAKRKGIAIAFLFINYVYKELLGHPQVGASHPETQNTQKLLEAIEPEYIATLSTFDQLTYFHIKIQESYTNGINCLISNSKLPQPGKTVQNLYLTAISFIQKALQYLKQFVRIKKSYSQKQYNIYIICYYEKFIEFQYYLKKKNYNSNNYEIFISLITKKIIGLQQNLKSNIDDKKYDKKFIKLLNTKFAEFKSSLENSDLSQKQKRYKIYFTLLYKEYITLSYKNLVEQLLKLQDLCDKALVKFHESLGDAYSLNDQLVVAKFYFKQSLKFIEQKKVLLPQNHIIQLRKKLTLVNNELKAKNSKNDSQSKYKKCKSLQNGHQSQNNQPRQMDCYTKPPIKKIKINLNQQHLFMLSNNNCKKRKRLQNNQLQRKNQRIINADDTQHYKTYLLLSYLIKSAETIYQQINKNNYPDENFQEQLTEYNQQIEEIKKNTTQVKQRQNLIKQVENIIKGLEYLQNRKKEIPPQFNNN